MLLTFHTCSHVTQELECTPQNSIGWVNKYFGWVHDSTNSQGPWTRNTIWENETYKLYIILSFAGIWEVSMQVYMCTYFQTSKLTCSGRQCKGTECKRAWQCPGKGMVTVVQYNPTQHSTHETPFLHTTDLPTNISLLSNSTHTWYLLCMLIYTRMYQLWQ